MSVGSLLERAGLWPLRGLWVALPIVFGATVGNDLDTVAQPLVAEGALWVLWFLGLLATLVPGPVPLTTIRILAPATIVAALVIGGGAGAAAAAYGVLVTVVSLLPSVGDRMINGSAYGSERRMALRPPAYVLLGPVQIAWALVVAGVGLPVWLAATERWVSAAIAAVIGVAAVWLGWRVLHQLSRRWLVFVPAGFVLHDHLLVAESILMRRSTVSSLGPAQSGSEGRAVDLTGGASGLALEVVLDGPTPFALRRRGRLDATESANLMFSPTLPGAVLTEARVRAITIGAA
ncbi:MAG: hypothetical protein AAF467_01735 [Actinomycetota bacterium]